MKTNKQRGLLINEILENLGKKPVTFISNTDMIVYASRVFPGGNDQDWSNLIDLAILELDRCGFGVEIKENGYIVRRNNDD